MKKALQNIALAAVAMGGVVYAYGPSAQARNYGSAIPVWITECASGIPGLQVHCSFEESTEHYKNGSYKEEVIYEPSTAAFHAEEAREIAAEGRSMSWCSAAWMLEDFKQRLGRTVDAASEQIVDTNCINNPGQ
jgi:hypothetical protein